MISDDIGRKYRRVVYSRAELKHLPLPLYSSFLILDLSGASAPTAAWLANCIMAEVYVS